MIIPDGIDLVILVSILNWLLLPNKLRFSDETITLLLPITIASLSCPITQIYPVKSVGVFPGNKD
jgi:hypothetical protein